MPEKADALLAVYDGKSPGTRNTIETAKALGLDRVCVESDGDVRREPHLRACRLAALPLRRNMCASHQSALCVVR